MLKTYPSWTHFSYGHCRTSVVHTMINFTLITAFILCSLNWICVSVSETQTVEVQPGQEAKLLTNISKEETVTFWSRLINRTRVNCISVMFKSDSKAEFCDGYDNGKFEMRIAGSSVFLRIKQVDFSDSGLYFCGFYHSGRPNFTVIDLKVTGSNESHDDMERKYKEECDGTAKLMSMILAGLSVFLVFLVMVIIGLVVQNRKLQTEEQKPEQSENHGSDEMNYAAVTFRAKAKRRELEPNVVYAATR
ncbi:uncharacterized protein LOC121177249 isoform X2 [Toxotes jaculatrix]|uniref:uncharacterized protein LOC121177249 isoform X2 n=1 Tax=Toxotes jaculatrix TaxID=941984 RepID=UPI001B3B0AD9|nr:uncharacterized protein LOC121177249 isoform X2 [Toxotes jaculatrix]